MPPRVTVPRNAKKGAPQKAKKGTLKRLLGMLFAQNKKLLIAIIVCIVITSITGVASSFFLKTLLGIINDGLTYAKPVADGGSGLTGNEAFDKVLPSLITVFAVMGSVYLVNVICSFVYTRLGAILTQKFLHQTRTGIFNKMQSLPISYFDSPPTRFAKYPATVIVFNQHHYPTRTYDVVQHLAFARHIRRRIRNV